MPHGRGTEPSDQGLQQCSTHQIVVIRTAVDGGLSLNGVTCFMRMSYEPGSLDCRLLIDAKHHLELALASLSGLPQSDHIQRQLKAVHQQLEGMHDLKRSLQVDDAWTASLAGWSSIDLMRSWVTMESPNSARMFEKKERPAWLNWLFLGIFLLSSWQLAGFWIEKLHG